MSAPPRRRKIVPVKEETTTQRQTFTCDQIVTLVSLLESGGSDSERERSAERGNKEIPIVEKPPTLRKAGKSGELKALYPDVYYLKYGGVC